MSADPMITAKTSDSTGEVFVTTQWTCVLATRGESPEAKVALSDLCAAYWTPVYRFLLREGREEDTARELTQEFFARILAGSGFAHASPSHGRFRSYLLGAVKHFLSDWRDRSQALKRGGDAISAPLVGDGGTDSSPGLEAVDAKAEIPNTYFDRQWAFALIDRALSKLSSEMEAAGKIDQYSTLKPWLVGDAAGLSQTGAAIELGMSEGAVKVAIHRLRKRFRELVREEIAQTVADTAEIDSELRYLVDVLAAG